MSGETRRSTSVTEWEGDKRWADTWVPDLAEIIRTNAMHLIEVKVAPREADVKRATDFEFEVIGGTIAARVHRPAYWGRYWDWTVRSERTATGAKTELAKLLEGYARWYLYAWARTENAFGAYALIDLDMVRAVGMLTSQRQPCRNPSDGVWFVAIPVDEIRARRCMVADTVPTGQRLF